MPDREIELSLARLDERCKAADREISELKQAMSRMENVIAAYQKEAENQFVKKELFQPVQKAIFTVAGLIIMAVFTAIVGLVLPKH